MKGKMHSDIIYVKKSTDIPLFGIDFIGIIDRGTNVIEIKPLTLCNLTCKYCFVSAGDYETNFILSSDYIIEKVKEVVEAKGNFDIEIHIAPYGETFLYPELFNLLDKLKKIEGINIISMQSNGLLLTNNIVDRLGNARITRINISLNSLKRETAEFLCNCESYNMERLLKNIHYLLNSGIDVLFAPVWFPGENDEDIEELIKYVIKLRNKGYNEKNVQIGIQKYLIYKTGRKLKKINPKSWIYFYKYLSRLEKKYNVKLKLGPIDFGIHKRVVYRPLNLKKNHVINVQIISRGRWKNECIGRINEEVGIKLLLKKPLTFKEELIGKTIKARIIKANYKNNIFTALTPI